MHDPKGNVIFETWQQSADGSWFFVIETWFNSLFSSCLVPKHITENWKHSKESEPSLKNAVFQNWEYSLYSSRILSIYMLLYAITILESVKGILVLSLSLVGILVHSQFAEEKKDQVWFEDGRGFVACGSTSIRRLPIASIGDSNFPSLIDVNNEI